MTSKITQAINDIDRAAGKVGTRAIAEMAGISMRTMREYRRVKYMTKTIEHFAKLEAAAKKINQVSSG